MSPSNLNDKHWQSVNNNHSVTHIKDYGLILLALATWQHGSLNIEYHYAAPCQVHFQTIVAMLLKHCEMHYRVRAQTTTDLAPLISSPRRWQGLSMQRTIFNNMSDVMKSMMSLTFNVVCCHLKSIIIISI